jgi:hypothetical protein
MASSGFLGGLGVGLQKNNSAQNSSAMPSGTSATPPPSPAQPPQNANGLDPYFQNHEAKISDATAQTHMQALQSSGITPEQRQYHISGIQQAYAQQPDRLKQMGIPVPNSPAPATPKMIPTTSPDVQAVQTKFPALGRYLKDVVIQTGTNSKGDDRQVETYVPWESENPNKGKITIQPFRPELTSGANLTNTVAGELLHYIGGINPSTHQPVDPQYQTLKQAVLQARTPQQQALDQREYNEQRKQGETRPFNDWLNQSRGDEYIMGYVTPDATDEWRKNGFYNAPAMKTAIENIKNYLTRAQ